MALDDDTVYCDVQMPVTQGRELLRLVNDLRDSGGHPNLDTVFARMLLELEMATETVENPRLLGAVRPPNIEI